MIRNAYNLTFKFCKSQHQYSNYSNIYNSISKRCLSDKIYERFQQDKDNDSSGLVKVETREIYRKEFPDYFGRDGELLTRISYVDFIDQALEKLQDLGLERDLNAYKELLKVFPPGKYCQKSSWDLGMFHAPQQLAAMRVLFKMNVNLVRPDKEMERIVVAAFGKNSDVWKQLARMIYWSMKGRNVDQYPIPEKIGKETHEIAKIAITRMLDDQQSLICVKNTSSLPNVVDKTWVVYAQSPLQQSIIERLDNKTILYIEQFGNSYVADKHLSYFVLKLYEDEETIMKRKQKPEISYNYNFIKMRFYGKPVREKLQELEDIHHVDDGHILGIAITGTSSDDSALSWLKLMQQRNPNLKNLSVVFRLQRPTYEIIDIKKSNPG